MERHEIEIFLTLAEELHFGRTGERLHVSAAMVSQTIKKVERRLGGPLFERTSRKVELTALGRQLYDDLHPHYVGIQQAVGRAAITAKGIAGTLRIGFLGDLAGAQAHAAARVFRERHPDCTVEINEVQIGEYIFPLRDGELDMMITLSPLVEPDVTVGLILPRRQTYAGLPSGHRLAQRESLVLEDLAGMAFPSLVEGVPDYWIEPYHPRWTPGGRSIGRTSQRCATYPEFLALVASGQAVCVGDSQVLDFYTRPDVVYVPLLDARRIEHALVWLTSAENARMRAYMEAVRDTAETILPEVGAA
ncbi:LysR family transcriptional regulator [Yinghuangia seranimata]|uniref:LysR family transcriptional regulator n=1 Tax=Yinghuangia seranimata TaxID=408067 RepID=UPI00248C0131|nr:LysR substrate-binding domain-containing protein [Yinghuangia seranimata]MDI2125943.1 LysR substrate-binding domain-containing protein [Yinghuangia seranimata]